MSSGWFGTLWDGNYPKPRGREGRAAHTKTNDGEIARLFRETERALTCLVPADHRIGESLRRQVKREKAVRVARGMYARASYWRSLSKPQQALHILRTLQNLHPDWTFCCESAALAFGLPVSFKSIATVHVATSRSSRVASSDIIRRHVVEDDRPVTMQGIRVTSLSRTVFDCMRGADFKQALACADGALRLSGKSREWFISQFKRMGGTYAGVRHAIRTMRYANACSESGGESIARATMIQQGFALPRLQVALPHPGKSRRSYRVDFLWTRLDGSRVIGEFDGMQKYEDAALRNGRSPVRVLADEQHRESQLTLLGMPIVRFSYRDVTDERTFESLLRRYGIPQSEEVARCERRLMRSQSTSALIFAVESLPE